MREENRELSSRILKSPPEAKDSSILLLHEKDTIISRLESKMWTLRRAFDESQARNAFYEDSVNRLKDALRDSDENDLQSSRFKQQFIQFLQELESCKKDAVSLKKINNTQKSFISDL